VQQKWATSQEIPAAFVAALPKLNGGHTKECKGDEDLGKTHTTATRMMLHA
jgi:hypothetical protein